MYFHYRKHICFSPWDCHCVLLSGASKVLIWLWLYLKLVLFTYRHRDTPWSHLPHLNSPTQVYPPSPGPTETAQVFQGPHTHSLSCYTDFLATQSGVVGCMGRYWHIFPSPGTLLKSNLPHDLSVLSNEMWADVISGQKLYKSFWILVQSVSFRLGPRRWWVYCLGFS